MWWTHRSDKLSELLIAAKVVQTPGSKDATIDLFAKDMGNCRPSACHRFAHRSTLLQVRDLKEIFLNHLISRTRTRGS